MKPIPADTGQRQAASYRRAKTIGVTENPLKCLIFLIIIIIMTII